ncbi:MAG: caspase domain-containing protein, partial [Alphaproteobacteria bacterium]
MIASRDIVQLLVALFAAIPCASVGADQPAFAPSNNGVNRPHFGARLGGDSSADRRRATFIEAAYASADEGVCEVLSPDPAYVDEMLSQLQPDGAKKYERRVALVVGNGAYQKVTRLTNPPNDANSMARLFRAIGFTVYRAIDVTEAGLGDCFSRFKADLEISDANATKADIALFFYAGHGVQLTSAKDNKKRNYMLSVDARVDEATGKAAGFTQIDAVLTEMRAHAKQAAFFYDACRNAPFGAGVVKQVDGQSVRQFDASGAAPINAEETDAASQAGLFIAYATSPNKTADDSWAGGASTHSPFTQALLDGLAIPGETLDQALAGVFDKVLEKTNGRQTPWISSSLTADLRLNGQYGTREISTRTESFAVQSSALREQGRRQGAIIAALKGLPKLWIEGDDAKTFGLARAELARSIWRKSGKSIGGDAMRAKFSPDGRRIVTTDVYGRSARVFVASIGKKLLTFAGDNEN